MCDYCTFKNKKIIFSKLVPFGFTQNWEIYTYQCTLFKSGFILTVQVGKDGIISSEIIESEFLWTKTPNNAIYRRIDESYQLAKGRK